VVQVAFTDFVVIAVVPLYSHYAAGNYAFDMSAAYIYPAVIHNLPAHIFRRFNGGGNGMKRRLNVYDNAFPQSRRRALSDTGYRKTAEWVAFSNDSAYFSCTYVKPNNDTILGHLYISLIL
jgi:hypothetical protein